MDNRARAKSPHFALDSIYSMDYIECDAATNPNSPLTTADEVILMRRQSHAVVGHAGPSTSRNTMSDSHALAALAALGQPTRLEIFRLLMRREPEELPAGTIAEHVGCQQNTLSTHLGILARSGLVRGARDGRFIIYHASVEGMRALLGFLITAAEIQS
jgi:ArsR family transcriptional regulator, arsenate/arsenite/antimonite-responsive transcriptional repressor